MTVVICRLANHVMLTVNDGIVIPKQTNNVMAFLLHLIFHFSSSIPLQLETDS